MSDTTTITGQPPPAHLGSTTLSVLHMVLGAAVTALLSVWGAQYVAKAATADAMERGLAVIEERQNNQYRELKDSIRELREDLRETGRLRRD